ncbi:hypothetical protein [Afifella pfennigii]|uniref:hypothetical protein n=1 Tax=Afifella pfennigii TaxID=209897 RepID=UPI0006919EE9|nr:hypothetical protein [Afifella pfennigii]
MRASFILGLLGGIIGLSPVTAPASAADLQRSYDASIYGVSAPADPSICEEPWVLNYIAKRFAWAEQNTWQRGFVINTLLNPRLSYVSGTAPARILAEHCTADAVMTDGTTRDVYYIVEKGMGLASIGDGVTFCVLGLDPWRVYDADCRTVR